MMSDGGAWCAGSALRQGSSPSGHVEGFGLEEARVRPNGPPIFTDCAVLGRRPKLSEPAPTYFDTREIRLKGVGANDTLG